MIMMSFIYSCRNKIGAELHICLEEGTYQRRLFRGPFQAHGIPPGAAEQSRTRGNQSSGVEDQPQCRELWHSSSPSARSFSRSPSPPPPSFTQSPSPPRSLVRDGQTSPPRPRLVVSRSTCPPLSLSPHANSFVIGTAVIETQRQLAGYSSSSGPLCWQSHYSTRCLPRGKGLQQVPSRGIMEGAVISG
jgi:hypothetical protein